eukprot:3754287-Rhodomonas_salina.2
MLGATEEAEAPTGKTKLNLRDLSPEQVLAFRRACELGDGTKCTLFGVCLGQVSSAISLPLVFAMPGTDPAYGATRMQRCLGNVWRNS